MKKKKSLIAIIALLLVVVVGATFAYFHSSTSFENVFNTGTYKVVTTEVFESPSNWVPGQEIPKTITSKNEGTIPAAVRVSYTEQWLDEEENDITSQVDAGTAIINLDNTNEWTKEGNYYYYNYILKPNETTSSFMKSVTLNPNLGNDVTCTTSQDGLTKTCESSNPALGAKYILTITKETVQFDKYQSVWNTEQSITEKPLIQIMNSARDKDTLQVGDEICINGDTTECFNFIKYDGDNIVMLSKYNLKVGNIYDSSGYTKIGEYTQSDSEYGLQSSEARGYVSGETSYGTVAFSGTNYWYDGSSLKPEYNSELNPNNIYDTDYNEASGNNYSVAYYVENYKNTLESYGLTVNDARLLTYSEAGESSIGTGFIANTSFWLSSAAGGNFVCTVYSGGVFNYSTFSIDKTNGVRPVIVISKSDI